MHYSSHRAVPWAGSRLLTVIVVLVGAMARVAEASIALSFTGGVQGGLDYNIGWSFSTSKPIEVDALGYFDVDSNGLAHSHQVGIFTTGGTLLVSATVASGTTDPLTNGFRYHTTLTGSPLLLPGSYVLGARGGFDNFMMQVPAGNTTFGPGITYGQDRYDNDPSFDMPQFTFSPQERGYFGPNFQYDIVPEPLSLIVWSVVILVGISAFSFSRRLRCVLVE